MVPPAPDSPAPDSTEPPSARCGLVPASEGSPPMSICITLGLASITATMEDNPTARDFLSLLPLTVTLRDFSPAEKISGGLPRRLSEEDAPASGAGAIGDIAYYAPWANMAFYRGRGPVARGVVKIATITAGIEALNQPGSQDATISRADAGARDGRPPVAGGTAICR
ncbi:MAG: hypothetical protein F8N37_19905 [Telmatospirillum sp.]|nr:hypothetical protein [Telmatospirillum sp.]